MVGGNPDLSITIVSYNTRDLTLQCLRSICENTRSIGFEVWVIDNNSSDGSPDAVRAEFPQVHVITNDVNVGLAAATNQGLEKSTGRYVLALNSDTVISSDAFATLVRFMDEHPDAGGATPRLVLPDGGAHPMFFGDLPTLGSELRDVVSAFRKSIAASGEPKPTQPVDLETTREVPCILWGTSFIVRREVYDKIGGQDPLFFVYGEDTDWAMRIVRAGWKLYYVSEAVVVHYGGRSTKQASVRMSAQLWRSRCRFMQKHYGLASALILRAFIVSICTFRLVKWLPIYVLPGSKRQKAAARIQDMWTSIRTVLSY